MTKTKKTKKPKEKKEKEDLSTWSQKRINQASIREQLYDINNNYLDNKELAAVCTWSATKMLSVNR